MRLNRYLASCGLGSRRSVEKLITERRVVVNGEYCTNLATQVSDSDEVFVNGKACSPQTSCTIIVNKERGIVTTRSDERNRTTIYDKLPSRYRTLSHVGRLDMDSEGLVVLTNNGDLAQTLTKPGEEVEKEYIVTLDTAYNPEDKTELLNGIKIPEGLARVKRVNVVSPRRLQIILTQGLKRQIRQMLSFQGYTVKKLLRTKIGGIEIEDLKPGKWKVLNQSEISLLSKTPTPGRAPKRPRSMRKKFASKKKTFSRKRPNSNNSRKSNSRGRRPR